MIAEAALTGPELTSACTGGATPAGEAGRLWQETRLGRWHMRFAVPHLERLSKAVRSLSSAERRALSAMLHRRQPHLCQIIDEVGKDPRCVQAHRFCTMFCGLAIEHAEGTAGNRLPRYPRAAIQEAAGFIARGEEAQIGRRACGYPERIHRHVVGEGNFDEDDTTWLCTTISAFLFVVERSLGRER